MKALEILKYMASKAKTKTQSDILIEAIAELEEFMKPKSCDGCKYQMHTINDVQSHGNWMKYSVFYDCVNDKSCKRKSIDRYEPKEEA